MGYDEAVQAEVSAKAAMREVAKHGCEWAEFVQDCGDKAIYKGQEVLDWLGY
jgi:hypothetical protein